MIDWLIWLIKTYFASESSKAAPAALSLTSCSFTSFYKPTHNAVIFTFPVTSKWQQSLSPSGWIKSLGRGVSHTGSPSPLSSILHVHQVEPQVLHVVLHDVDPPFSLSAPTLLSMYVLPPRFSWHNPPLLDVVHAQTISTWYAFQSLVHTLKWQQ